MKLKANQPLEATVGLSISKLETQGALTVTTSTFMVLWESCSGGICVAVFVTRGSPVCVSMDCQSLAGAILFVHTVNGP